MLALQTWGFYLTKYGSVACYYGRGQPLLYLYVYGNVWLVRFFDNSIPRSDEGLAQPLLATRIYTNNTNTMPNLYYYVWYATSEGNQNGEFKKSAPFKTLAKAKAHAESLNEDDRPFCSIDLVSEYKDEDGEECEKIIKTYAQLRSGAWI